MNLHVVCAVSVVRTSTAVGRCVLINGYPVVFVSDAGSVTVDGFPAAIIPGSVEVEVNGRKVL